MLQEASGFSRVATDVDEAPPPFVEFGKVRFACTMADKDQRASG